MGVFGGLMILLGLTSHAVVGVQNSITNEKNKELARSKGRQFYMDYKGVSRCIKTDRPVIHTEIMIDGCKHSVLKYCVSDEIAYDYTVEQMNETSKEGYEFAKRIGASVYLCDDSHHIKETLEGQRVKDIKTGDIYVIRSVMYGEYFMDVKTYKMIRPTDRQILDWKLDKTRSLFRYHSLPTIDEIQEYMENMPKTPQNKFSRPWFKEDKYYELTIKNQMKELGIDKIYHENETWEDKKKEFYDLGTSINLPRNERFEIIRDYKKRDEEKRKQKMREYNIKMGYIDE